MSLEVQINHVTGLKGKGGKNCRITFRDLSYQTRTIEDFDDRAQFNEIFQWPVASSIEEREMFEISVFTYNKVFSNRLIGKFKMILQQVVKLGELSIEEPLLDANNTALKTSISLNVKYLAPDGTVGNWAVDEFSPTSHLQPDHPGMELSTGSIYSSSYSHHHSGASDVTTPLIAEDGGGNGATGGANGQQRARALNKFRTLAKKAGQGKDQQPSSMWTKCGGSDYNLKQQTKTSNDNFKQLITSGKTKGILSAVGLRSKQRPPASPDDDMVFENTSISQENEGATAREPRLLIDTIADDDKTSMASMTVIDQPVTNKRSKPETRTEIASLKAQDFQISVTVIEARQLSGTNMDPVCLVQVGEDRKYTTQKESTNCPYYNEVFVFDYTSSRQILFDKILTLTVLHSRNLIRSGTLVGKFKIDLGTIYSNQDHGFFHKWAVLTDPSDLMTGPKGYLKVDVAVVGKGDNIKIPKINDENSDDIENNLLLPDGVQPERQRARFIFKIYQAEGLPKMNTSIAEKLKTVLQGEARDLVDPFVEISFCGQKGRTTVKRNCYEPCWNEQITFTELFPPLCKRIKIQIRDKDNLNNTVIGTTFIELDRISNSGDRGFLPTFGPSYVNMYGSPRVYTMVNELSDLNNGLGEGVAFRGRLLLALSVELVDVNSSDLQGSTDVEVENIPPLSELGAGRVEEFFLFGSFLEANMISPVIAEKSVTFEVSMGNYGNGIDGANVSHRSHRSNGDGDSDEDSLDEDDHTLLLREPATIDPNMRTTSPAAKPVTHDKYYYHMPFFEQKPCIYMTSYWHDHKRRLYNSNIIQKIIDKLDEGIQDVQEMIKTNEDRPDRRLRGVAEELINGCVAYSRLVKGTGGPAAGRTKLDRERHKMCLRDIDGIANEVRKIKKRLKMSTYKEKLSKMKTLLQKLKCFCEDPQHSIPDIFIWMLSGRRRVAYSRITARQILHSVCAEECGQHCGKIQTLFLKLPGKKRLGTHGWTIQAKVEIYLWLGLAKNKRDYLNGLPTGYEVIRTGTGLYSPPMYLRYEDRQQYELRAHLYQGRGLIASDDTGLSDPFAKVIFSTHCDVTQVIDETLNPTWDQTLVIPNITLFGRAEELRDDPPMIIVEIFDRDTVGKDEFIGRAVAKPVVKMNNESYEPPRFPPKLDWFQTYRGSNKAGEILASFELLQIKMGIDLEESAKITESVKTEQGHKFIVPRGIRPILAKHRVEVLFWGLRDLKRVQLISVDRPRVDIEIAGRCISSSIINNYKKNPNFADPVKFIEDVDLPEIEYWCPPISITAVDCRAFGRTTLVGTHIISNISKFVFRSPDKSKIFTGLKSNGVATETTDVFVDIEHQSTLATDMQIDMTGFGGEEPKTKEEEDSALDETALDWWSKYFASVETLAEEKKKYEEEKIQDLFNEENDDNGGMNNDGDVNTLISANADDMQKEKRFGKNFLKGAMGAVMQAKKNFAAPVRRLKKQKEQIDELKIFDTELENCSEFTNFTDLLHSFDLYRGKREEMADELSDQKRIVGTFKGAFRIYRYPLPVYVEQPDPQYGMFKGLPSNEPIHVMVRVYIVRATDLHPTDPNGKADPYVVVSLGSNKNNDKENYISKQLNPIFGKAFDFEATFPQESVLTVQIFDWDLLSSDDLIGETKIDLENRFYSKHRPTCGIAEKYAIFGYNQWRDPMKPSQILHKLCKEMKIDGPHFSPGKVRVGKKIFTGPIELEDENGHKKPTDEHVALVALRHWEEIPKFGNKLVPEHVETRSLYSPEKPGIEQGRVELWVDMFPMDMPPPGPPVDISPRKPKSFQLRVIIWNTDDVVLQDDDFFTGDKASDIYVKGWLLGDDKQETDIHYRSLTGEGNFNWRFIFPFDYLIAEEKCVITKKESVFSWDETEFKIPPRLNLQVWDADHFSADDFLGSLTLDLTRFPRGAKSSNKCTLNLASEEDESSDVPMISLFKQRRIKGWWPFTAKSEHDELEITGKVEAEISLLTVEDAEKNPAGQGRDEPDPLEKPNRPDTSFVWFMNPLKSLRYLICARFKWLIIKIVIVVIILALVVLFIYSSPSWLMKKIVGA